MKSFILSLLIVSSVSIVANAADNSLTDHERNDGWLLLFDGQSTKGWMSPNDCLRPERSVAKRAAARWPSLISGEERSGVQLPRMLGLVASVIMYARASSASTVHEPAYSFANWPLGRGRVLVEAIVITSTPLRIDYLV